MSETLVHNYEVAPPPYEVVWLTGGLGFGEGAISRFAVEELEGNEDLSRLTDEALHDPALLVPISRIKNNAEDEGEHVHDDGCGDGRVTGMVFGTDENGDIRVLKSSLTRPKVFGGGITMTVAAKIGNGEAVDLDLPSTFREAGKELDERDIAYGAHTVSAIGVANSNKSGCGAIDEAPAIIKAAVRYADRIADTVQFLLGEGVPELYGSEANGVRTPGIFEYFAQATNVDQSDYSGARIMADIIDSGKVVKALEDKHLETRIVLNHVRGFTADQNLIRERTKDETQEFGRAQIFSVDVWRMQDIAKQLYPDSPALERRAFVSELVYTLATAAVLTKGDLPVAAVRALPTEV